MQKSTNTRIDTLLDILNISQLEFARQLGVTSGAIGNWKKRDLGMNVINKIITAYPQVNVNWLTKGEGDVLKPIQELTTPKSYRKETKPRLPILAAAGSLSEYISGVKLQDCEQVPIVSRFPSYDFTMYIKGDSMEPKFEGGDEIACKRVYDVIEWGKTYVLDTNDGAVIKRIYDDGDNIRCVSYNKEYPDFTVRKDCINGIFRVVGLIRI